MRAFQIISFGVIVPAFLGLLVSVLARPAMASDSKASREEIDDYVGEASPIPMPKPGDTVRLPSKDAFGRPMPKSGEELLVAAGDCYVCSAHRWDPRQILPLAKRPVTVIYWMTADKVKDLSFIKAHARVLFDPQQRILPEEFNYRAPEAYVIQAEKGEVVKVPENDESILPFVVRSAPK